MHAGDKAPGDAPGVKAIRAHKTIPAGYVLIGQKVDVQRGDQAAGAALRFVCPGDKRLQTFLVTGRAGIAAERTYRNRHATPRHATNIISIPSAKDKQASGVVYAICR